MIEPTPTPENAMLNASPRRRANQLVRVERLAGVGQEVHAASDQRAKGQVKLPRLPDQGRPDETRSH